MRGLDVGMTARGGIGHTLPCTDIGIPRRHDCSRDRWLVELAARLGGRLTWTRALFSRHC